MNEEIINDVLFKPFKPGMMAKAIPVGKLRQEDYRIILSQTNKKRKGRPFTNLTVK